MSLWGDQQWFKARLAGLSNGSAQQLRGSTLDRARRSLRPYIERCDYAFHKEQETPLGISQSIFKCLDGPINLFFSCHHYTPPDTCGFCFSLELRWGLFGKRVPAHRLMPEQERARILEQLGLGGILARAWDVIAEDDNVGF